MEKFQEVVAQLEQALFDFPYNELDISDEVREQVTSTTRLNRTPFQSFLSTEL
jgi:hypothetical protein